MALCQLKPLFIRLFFLICLMSISSSFAEPLRQWESWVLKKHPQHTCPWTAGNLKSCVWPGELTLGINDSGGSFNYTADAYEQQSFLPLPGNIDHWPSNVVVNGNAARLIERGGIPYVAVTEGHHTITGHFQWTRRPGQLAVPHSIAIVSLFINSKEQLVDRRKGQLIFSNNNDPLAKKTSDNLKIDVFRLVQDGVPVKATTHIRLSVSGKAREVSFGRVLLEGTEVLQVRSPIPARIEADGTIRAQVTPGEHILEVLARFTTLPSTITTQKLSDEWPEIEYISFQSAPFIRQAKLSGVASIDTNQIAIPTSWSQFPSYRMTEQSTLSIETEFRGDHSPAANELQLQRDLWLDFDGKGLTAFDQINGEMSKDWRLNVANHVQLGRATVDGAPTLITHDKGRQGIEIRSPAIDVEATSRTDINSGFSASGWDASVSQYASRLHLPPGWRVVHASGVDRIQGTWLSGWDLWDVFLLLIIIAATRKLMGIKVAALSVATFLVALHEPGTPLMIIPVLLVIIALLPVMSGRFKRWLRNTGFVFIGFLVLLIIGFSVDRFRLAIYPSLEQARIGVYDHNRYATRVQKKIAPELSLASADTIPTQSLWEQEIAAAPVPQKQRIESLYQVTENDRVQTGPGQPNWTWNSIHFWSSGPIPSEQTLSIYYSKPLFTSIWLVLSVLLVFIYSALVIARLIKLGKVEFNDSGSSKAVLSKDTAGAATMVSLCLVAMLLTALPYSSTAVAEDYPPKYLLDELEERLTKKPDCLPNCVSLSDGFVRIESSDLEIYFNVYADANVSIPLPSGHSSWVLTSVEQEGEVLPLKKEGDNIFVALTKGHHKLKLEGTILDEQASIHFPIAIHNLSISTSDWTVEGLVDGRVTKGVLTLRAKDQGTAVQVDTLKADPAPTFARVVRHFHFGKRWTVYTTVVRETTDGAVSIPIKLLPNERLLSDVGVIDNNQVTVQFEHQQQHIKWTSSLEPVQQLLLEASDGAMYLEEWSFTPSSMWRLEYDGIPPLKLRANANAFEPTFKPWPGEALTVNIRRPEGVSGDVHTVESALLKVEAGSKLQRSILTLNIRASIGTDYPITLPEDVEVLKFIIDGKVMNTPAGHKVIVPLQPREQVVEIEFQSRIDAGMISRSPQIYLPGKATNIRLQYQLPRDRWPLYLKGPAIGPAMLYWGVLFIIILGAIGLPYLARAMKLNIPVSTVGWLLLGLGLSTVNSYGVIVIAIMFFILAARKDYVNPSAMSWVTFNAMQIGIIFWGVLAVLCMIVAIPMGLLSNPEMKVVGNGSGSHFYRYYQDIASAEGGLPTATIASVPLFAYRVVMLLWALWLSTRLIKWAAWAWSCYKEKGAWLPSEPKQKKSKKLSSQGNESKPVE